MHQRFLGVNLLGGIRPPVIALLLTLLLVLITTTILIPVYNTNDDAGMRLYLSGGYYHAPAMPHVFFIHIWLAESIVWLYAHFPTILWYDGLLLFFLCLASFCLLHALIQLRRDWPFCLLVTMFTVAILATLFFQMQYTLIAGYLSGCGMVAGLCALHTTGIPARRFHLYCFACVNLGALLRFDPALLVAGFTLGAGLPLLTRHRLPDLFSWAFMVAASLGVAAALHYIHLLYYQTDPEWNTFPDSIRLLHIFGQYNPMLEMPEASQQYSAAFGWSPNDFEIFRTWFYSPLLASHEMLTSAYATLSPAISKAWHTRLYSFPWFTVFTAYLHILWPCLILLALTCLCLPSLPALCYTAYISATTLLTLTLLEFNTKPVPFRVYYAFVPVIFGLLLLSSVKWKARPLPRFWLSTCLAAAALSALSLLNDNYTASTQLNARASAVIQDMASLTGSQPENTEYMVWGFPYEFWMHPFQPIPAADQFRVAFSAGVFSQSPQMLAQFARYHIDTLEQAPCLPHMLLATERPAFIPLLQQSLREHYQQERNFNPVFRGQVITVYQCHP